MQKLIPEHECGDKQQTKVLKCQTKAVSSSWVESMHYLSISLPILTPHLTKIEYQKMRNLEGAILGGREFVKQQCNGWKINNFRKRQRSRTFHFTFELDPCTIYLSDAARGSTNRNWITTQTRNLGCATRRERIGEHRRRSPSLTLLFRLWRSRNHESVAPRLLPVLLFLSTSRS